MLMNPITNVVLGLGLLIGAHRATPAPLPVQQPVTALTVKAVGNAYHYYQGLMERVGRKRQAWGQLKLRHDVDGYASTPNARNIGKVLYVRFLDSGIVERFQIVDCSAPRDLAAQLARGLVAEFDYLTAKRHPTLLRTGHIRIAILGVFND
jgi:hypothetical protein